MTPAQIIAAIKKEFPKLCKRALNSDKTKYEYYIPCGECKQKTKLAVACNSLYDGFSLVTVGTHFLADHNRANKFQYGGYVYYNDLEDGDIEVFMNELRRVVPKISHENDSF